MKNIIAQIKDAETQGKRQFRVELSKEYKAIEIFKGLKSEGYCPELEESNDFLFLVVPLKPSKVINLFDYKPKNHVLAVEDNVIRVEFGRVK